MIINTLKNITHHLGIKIPHRQAHHFNQEIGDKGDINAGAKMQQYPTTDKAYSRTTKSKKTINFFILKPPLV